MTVRLLWVSYLSILKLENLNAYTSYKLLVEKKILLSIFKKNYSFILASNYNLLFKIILR